MDKFWVFFELIIAAAGGGGVAALVFIKFFGKMVADMAFEKFKSSLGREEETLKSTLNTKQYVTQSHYDKVYCIYEDITTALSKTNEILFLLIPQDGDLNCYPNKLEERKKYIKKIEELKKEYDNTNSLISRYSPFIEEELCQSYKEILQLIKEQIMVFSAIEKSGQVNLLKEEDFNTSKMIDQKYNEISGQIRRYLASLLLFPIS